MHRHFFSLRIAGLVILAGIAFASIDLFINGFAVVHDPDGLVARAELVGADRRTTMRAFARGYFAARPRFDGTIVVTCRNGIVSDAEYVSAGMQTSRTITPADCRRR